MPGAGDRATSARSGRRRNRLPLLLSPLPLAGEGKEGEIELFLTHRAEEGRARALHDAFDRALEFRRRAFLAGAIVDPERVLEIAEVAVGLAVIAQRRAAGLDRVVQHRLDGICERICGEPRDARVFARA